MFFDDCDEIKFLRKKHTKEKIIVFTGGKKKSISRWKKVIHKVLKIMSKDLNFDIT